MCQFDIKSTYCEKVNEKSRDFFQRRVITAQGHKPEHQVIQHSLFNHVTKTPQMPLNLY